MNLRKVKPGFVVLLPEAWWRVPDDQVRAMPGEIIDVDAPGEAELLADQHYKLETAPAGSVPTPIAHRRVKQFLRDAAAKAGVPAGPATIDEPKAPRAPRNAQGVPAVDSASLPKVDGVAQGAAPAAAQTPAGVAPQARQPRAPAPAASAAPVLPGVDALPNVAAKPRS